MLIRTQIRGWPQIGGSGGVVSLRVCYGVRLCEFSRCCSFLILCFAGLNRHGSWAVQEMMMHPINIDYRIPFCKRRTSTQAQCLRGPHAKGQAETGRQHEEAAECAISYIPTPRTSPFTSPSPHTSAHS